MNNIIDRFNDYRKMLAEAMETVDQTALQKACEILTFQYHVGNHVFVCGNGGSAAIAEHFNCDHSKGCSTNTHILPRVVSLCSNFSLMSAISNDISFDDVFSHQLNSLGRAYDVLVVISSSGNSPNIISAIEVAKRKHIAVIALVGFNGGKAAQMADCVLHVKSHNYGVVEDCHQSLSHILAQHIRVNHLNAGVDPSSIKL